MQNIIRNVSLLLSPSFAFEECLISVHYNAIDVVRSVRMSRISMFYTTVSYPFGSMLYFVKMLEVEDKLPKHQ